MNQTALLIAALCAAAGLFVLLLARPLSVVVPKLRWSKPVSFLPDRPEFDKDAVVPVIRLVGVGLLVAALLILVAAFGLARAS